MPPREEEFSKTADTTGISISGGGDGSSSSSSDNHNDGYYLRWSRLRKTIEVQDNNNGGVGGGVGGGGGRRLMRGGSIIGSQLFRNRNREGTSSGTSTNNSGTGASTKDILCGVSGYAAPGELLACMGPSGSGKSTLLNTLSGRTSFQDGTLSINGTPLKPGSSAMKRLMSKTAYVKQADIFFEHLTVRDQLTYTALLRLPQSTTKEQKHDEVERIISLLRLGKVAQNPINMCSGGEKKRVNIGTELLTDPAILLLDEPTSGLDSTSAVSLLKLLSKLAKENGKTVLTTIHQPSSQLFHSFDRLLMISEGYVVYFGTPSASLTYLRDQNMACPDGYNAADHWMNLLVMEDQQDLDNDDAEDTHNNQQQQQQQQQTSKDVEMGRRKDPPRLQLQMAWDNEAVAEEMDATLMDADDKSVAANDNNSSSNNNNNNSSSKKDNDIINKYNTSWMTQYTVLMQRSLKGSRSSIFTPLNMMKSVAIGVIAGMIWWQMPYTEKTVSDRSSYFFFTMTYWVFDAMFSALMAFPQEKVVLLKERASASYHLSAYFFAKTTSDAPVRLVLPLLYMVTSFWMAGIDDRFSVFVASVGCTLLSVLAGESLGLMIGASIGEMDKALTVMTVFTLALMLMGGFFVENIPVFLTWAKYFSPFKYAFDGSLQLVFDHDVPCDGSGTLESLCGGSSEGYASAELVVSDFLGVQGSIGFNVGMLVVISLVPRYFAYLALRAQKGGDRS